jgi:CCR4-NOT transcriptional regulation complex NOT5 subunit
LYSEQGCEGSTSTTNNPLQKGKPLQKSKSKTLQKSKTEQKPKSKAKKQKKGGLGEYVPVGGRSGTPKERRDACMGQGNLGLQTHASCQLSSLMIEGDSVGVALK